MKYIVLILFSLTNFAFTAVNLVKVDKSEQKMYLFDGSKIIKQYHVGLSTKSKGHKEQEGDQKTPEGTYTLDYKKEDSAYYRSMHISYPNAQDKLNAKKKGVFPGGFIMIHGQQKWL